MSGIMLATIRNRNTANVQYESTSIISFEFEGYPFTVVAQFDIFSNGLCSDSIGTQTWLLSGSASSYDVYLTSFSGDTPTGMAANTAYNLGTSRSIAVSQTGAGSKTFSCTLQIRDTGTSTVRASGTLSLVASIGDPV